MSLLATLRFILAHPVNSQQKLKAFARYVRWQLVSRTREDVVVSWVGDSKLIVRNGMTGATGNVYCGLHEFSEMGFLLHLLRSSDLFVDVGANVGSYTVLASSVRGCTSLALEPDPDAFHALERNVRENRIEDRVSRRRVAIGAERGSIRFTKGLDTMNHVAGDDDRTSQVVPQETLDFLLSDMTATLVKIDVEGYEDNVIRGAFNTLRVRPPLALQLETVSPSTRAELKRTGYVQIAYNPFLRSLSVGEGGSSGGNTIFVHDLGAVRSRVQHAPAVSVHGVLI